MARLCYFLLLAIPALPAPADDAAVFRSDVSLVRVDVQVLDRDNRAITGLRAGDFILREAGRTQPIRNFDRENMPLDVMLLFDVSASMRPHVQRIASAAEDSMQVLGEHDRIGIMVFDRSSRVRSTFRSNRQDVEHELEAMLRQETFRGGTDITRGLLDAARYVAREARHEARRAIVILTDDQTEKERDEERVSDALTRADAVVSLLLAPDAMAYRQYPGGGGRGAGQGRWGGYGGGGPWGGAGGGGGWGGPLSGIILGRRGGYGGLQPGGMPGGHTHSAGTAEIARQSGGDSMSVDDASALETTLARLRQRYALHFHLPEGTSPGQERNIEVELTEAARRRYPDAQIRFRRSYLAPSAGGPGDVTYGPTMVTRVPAHTGRASEIDQPPATPAMPAVRRRMPVDESAAPRGPIPAP